MDASWLIENADLLVMAIWFFGIALAVAVVRELV